MTDTEAPRCPACGTPLLPDGPMHECTEKPAALPDGVLFRLDVRQSPEGIAYGMTTGDKLLSAQFVMDALIQFAFSIAADEGGGHTITLPQTYHPERHD